MEKIIEIRGLQLRYGSLHVLHDVDLDVLPGDVMVICGPSGAGKSSLLRCINQLERTHEGEITVLGLPVVGPKNRKSLREVRMHCGMVFQHFNLFPHLTVLDNVTIGQVRVLKRDPAEAAQKAKDILARVGLSDKLAAFPDQISGGQKQRVAIARALAMDPKLMLFDEPTSALDPEMIKEVLDVMVDLARSGMTMIIVTHEMGFAREVATKVCFLEAGRILEVSDTAKFFENPSSERARGFLAKIL
ncbi:MAG TPA: amino acid ABC transporter ATP-binding protein [Spirochaetia bacterium]